ncbi:MAG: hypothetical protein IPI95_04565 [Flavobacteriales bacterium]|nr:hypothetical protein [Flavobacteriales bacterium]
MDRRKSITNTRANYSVAADIARDEAVYDARFSVLKKNLEAELTAKPAYRKYINDLENVFRYEQFKVRLDKLGDELVKTCSEYFTEEETQQEFLNTCAPSAGPSGRRSSTTTCTATWARRTGSSVTSSRSTTNR